MFVNCMGNKIWKPTGNLQVWNVSKTKETNWKLEKTLCITTGSLQVHVNCGQFCGDQDLPPPPHFFHFVSTCFLYLPTGSLWVHRNRCWLSGDLHLPTPALYFFCSCQPISRSVVIPWNIEIYVLADYFLRSHPHLDPWPVGPPFPFWNQHKSRNPWSIVWPFRWRISIQPYRHSAKTHYISNFQNLGECSLNEDLYGCLQVMK